jgi:isoamylase
VRDFWLRRTGVVSGFVSRVAGSPEIFNVDGRPPQSSINYIASHDGFTLQDLVSFEETHNEANGENNQDGMRVNRSWNCGVEGDTGDSWIRALRGREQRNLLTTLFVSQGIPMLLAGDEMGRTQRGNNNAYCQDNGISWVDWAGADRALLDFVRLLCRLRSEHPPLRRVAWPSGSPRDAIRIFDAHAHELTGGEPTVERGAVEILVPGCIPPEPGGGGEWTGDGDFLLLCNAREFDTLFSFPSDAFSKSWWTVIDTSRPAHVGNPLQRVSGALSCRAHSMVVLMGCETR